MRFTWSDKSTNAGFTLVEMMLVVGILGVLGAISLPMMTTALGNFRLSGDARIVAGGVSAAKMRAASKFTKSRLFVDLTGQSFVLQTYDKTTSVWTTEGGTTYISARDSFGFGTTGQAPPNTQGTIGQAPLCKDNANADIANTACVVFSSRGIPIDASGAPTAVDALYVTDGVTVYGITVSSTGLSRVWRAQIATTPSWSQQ
jgi:prepilin-type N-terminal cleavage/methylation domain-containing protein